MSINGNTAWHSGNLTNPITGTGTRTTNFVPKFSTDTNQITNSQIFDNGTNVGINITNPLGGISERTLHLSDAGGGSATYYATNSALTVRGIFSSASIGLITFGAQTNHPMQLITNDTPRLYITAGGNVLMGTTNELTLGGKLQVSGNINSTVTGGDAIVWATNGTVNTYLVGNTTGELVGIVGTASNHPFVLRTNNTERLRIASNGNVTINTPTGSVYALDINASNYYHLRLLGGIPLIKFAGSSYNGGNGAEIWQNTNGTVLFNVNGNFTGMTLNTSGNLSVTGDVIAFSSSDARLKDNLTKIDNSLEKINKLGGYSFTWNDKQDAYKGDDYGVVAQEVEALFPEMVTTRDNGYKAVKYEKLIPVLIEAVKELSKEVNELKGGK